MINRLVITLVCILGIQAGDAIAQSREDSNPLPAAPSVTKELPSNVTGLWLFNHQPQAWQQVSQFFPVPPGFVGPGFLPYVPPEIDFFTEVRPWLGNWSASVLMPSPGSDPNQQLADRTLTLAPVSDSSLLPRFLEQVQQHRSQPPTEREYQGAKILVWPEQIIPQSEITPPDIPLPPEPLSPQSQSKALVAQASVDSEVPIEPVSQVIPSLAIAVVPGYMAISGSYEAIEQWLDSRETGTSLANSANFQRTLANPDFDRSLFVGYGQVAQLAESFFDGEFDFRLPFPLPLPDSQQVETTLGLLADNYSSGEVLVWIDPQGLRSQSRIYYQTPLPASAIDPIDNTIYNQIPAATYLSISGQEFNQLVFGIFKGLLNQPAIAQVWQILANPNDNGQNTIPWMDGDYALFLFPSTSGLFPAFEDKLQLGMGMIIETSDRTAAMAGLQRLDRWAVRSSDENIILKQETWNGQPVTEWQVFNPQRQSMESLLSYSWLNNRTLIVASGLDPLKELHPQPYLSLNESFTFTTATNALPAAHNNYFYINFGSLLSLMNNFLDPAEVNNDPMLRLGRSILGNIRSIALNTSTTTIHTQADFFIVLSPQSRTP